MPVCARAFPLASPLLHSPSPILVTLARATSTGCLNEAPLVYVCVWVERDLADPRDRPPQLMRALVCGGSARGWGRAGAHLGLGICGDAWSYSQPAQGTPFQQEEAPPPGAPGGEGVLWAPLLGALCVCSLPSAPLGS